MCAVATGVLVGCSGVLVRRRGVLVDRSETLVDRSKTLVDRSLRGQVGCRTVNRDASRRSIGSVKRVKRVRVVAATDVIVVDDVVRTAVLPNGERTIIVSEPVTVLRVGGAVSMVRLRVGVRILDVSVRILDVSVRILDVGVGVLRVRMRILHVSVRRHFRSGKRVRLRAQPQPDSIWKSQS